VSGRGSCRAWQSRAVLARCAAGAPAAAGLLACRLARLACSCCRSCQHLYTHLRPWRARLAVISCQSTAPAVSMLLSRQWNEKVLLSCWYEWCQTTLWAASRRT